jgi:hypothetical protein
MGVVRGKSDGCFIGIIILIAISLAVLIWYLTIRVARNAIRKEVAAELIKATNK